MCTYTLLVYFHIVPLITHLLHLIDSCFYLLLWRTVFTYKIYYQFIKYDTFYRLDYKTTGKQLKQSWNSVE